MNSNSKIQIQNPFDLIYLKSFSFSQVDVMHHLSQINQIELHRSF